MTKHNVLRPLARANAIVSAAVLTAAAFLPAVLLSSSAGAAQLTSRYVDLSSVQSSGGDSSEGSGRDSDDAETPNPGSDVTYTVGFTTDAVGDYNVGGVVVEFCSNSPIIGLACTAPAGFSLDPTGAFDPGSGTDSTNLAIANQSGITDFVIDTANSDDNTLVLTRTAASVTAGTAIEFDLGSTAADDGIYNPTAEGTFYARILTYTTTAAAQGYTSTVPGAFEDDGGVAMAIANQLTITARVQEVLQFCVGTTDAGASSDCTDISGTDIDLGVVDSNSVQTSATDAGLAMIRTNAANGAVVYYKAEQDTSSGQLKIAGQACSGVTITDPCFNSAIGTGTAAAPVSNTIVNGTEEFGMTVTAVDTSNGGATTNLTRDAAYDGNGAANGSCTAADAGSDEECWAWADAGSFDQLASSSTVLDDEMLEIAFAATAAPTTPTGLYTVTANFVATSTF